jgi:hypothetical protein
VVVDHVQITRKPIKRSGGCQSDGARGERHKSAHNERRAGLVSQQQYGENPIGCSDIVASEMLLNGLYRSSGRT